MSDKVSHNDLVIKHAGQAIECGTLAVLLNAVVYQPVLVMPLQRVVSNGAQTLQQWAVHLTVQPNAKHGPVYYATFFAAQTMKIGETIGLISPYSFIEPTAETRGDTLQEELTQCLGLVATQNPRVSGIVQPARYRLPDEWVWSVQSRAPEIHLYQQHWTVSQSNLSC
jgi:hypothetical protein